MYQQLTNDNQLNNSTRTGVIKWFDKEKGYGFICPSDVLDDKKNDIFVHITELQKSGVLNMIREGQKVQFKLQSEKGKVFAVDIKIISD